MRSTLLALSLALLAACNSTWYDHRYAPAPQDELVQSGMNQGQARVLVTVMGVLKPKDDAPAAVGVRMRLENIGTQPFALEPEELALVSADLQPFREPDVTEPLQVPGGESKSVDVRFPLPEGRTIHDMNLDGLNLRFGLDWGDRRTTTSMSFDRVVSTYDSSPRFTFGVGVGTTL